MPYVDGFVIAVPADRKQEFIDHASKADSVLFSWIEWPDKATRDAAMGRMEELMKTDDRLNPEKNPMPFDGKRMIFGGFAPVVEL